MPLVAVCGDKAPELEHHLREQPLPDLELVALTDHRTTLDQVEILLGSPDAVLPLLDRCPALRWVQSTWAGITPLLGHPRRDYLLTGAKGLFGQAMSEYVLGWLLGIERRVIERAGATRWENSPDGSLAGKRLGILGTGSIGGHVARACQGLGLSIVGLNRDGRPVDGFKRCFAMDQREPFAEGLDYLVGLLPDTPHTNSLVNEALLARLAPGAIVINAGRSNSVVLADLLAALESGALRAAVLDVLPNEPLPDDSPLWQVPGLFITSHTAAPTELSAIAELFCDNYRRYLDGAPLLHLIDFERGY